MHVAVNGCLRKRWIGSVPNVAVVNSSTSSSEAARRMVADGGGGDVSGSSLGRWRGCFLTSYMAAHGFKAALIGLAGKGMGW